MSDSTEFMLGVDLNELNEPYKLAKWIQMLPKYRAQFLKNSTKTTNNINHHTNCQKLSEFMYQIQYCGKHLKSNFNENDFKELLAIIHADNNKYNYNDYIWIWDIIKTAQNTKKDDIKTPNKSTQKFGWVDAAWMEQNEYIEKNHESKSMYEEPYETKEFQRSEPYETNEIESAPVTMTNTSSAPATNTNKIPAENNTKKIITLQNNVQISVENYNEKGAEKRNSNSSKSSENNSKNTTSNKHLTTMTRSDDIENSHEDSGGHGPHGFGSIEDEEQAMLATPSDRHITQETKNRLNSDSIGIDEMVNKYELEQKNKTRIKGKKK
eukprot:138497_1